MTAIVVKEEQNGNSTTETYFTYKDHLGSIVALTNENGDVVLEQSFDAWGRNRNSSNWTYSNLTSTPTWLRGYTGHEHLPHFELINMNGRIYDPILGRMLSPDKYVQDPIFSQSYNRYSYVWNNPLRYTDPSGDIVAFTDFGYAFWKYVSPIAFKVNFNASSNGTSIGIDASFGVPQKLLIHARAEGGISYHFSDNKNNYQGWEFRYGFEVGIGPIKSANTNYAFQDKKYNQSTNVITIGGPKINFKYENDFMFGLPADGGDRYRTAAGKFSLYNLNVGFNLYTGDPGLTDEERNPQYVNGQLTYLKNEYGDDPDEYRSGVAYIGFAGLKLGRNSEKIRHAIQNRFAHDIAFALFSGGKKLPHFAKDHNKKSSWYWNIGTGTGNSLW
ncbi:hypothetical protein CW751_00580 [Brumimicrobium salinarum]|uniref:Uncharacterized protein n=2 Tax=Brumimicrobium salinarum TaxID=2058658 RepID=A0A2I0R6X5_9FLAO|nr:hypothetical protein CW751_00580 [Brumimicrobium salinarum]